MSETKKKKQSRAITRTWILEHLCTQKIVLWEETGAELFRLIYMFDQCWYAYGGDGVTMWVDIMRHGRRYFGFKWRKYEWSERNTSICFFAANVGNVFVTIDENVFFAEQ